LLIADLKPKFTGCVSSIQQSAISNQQSAISNQQSAIGNQQSAISNRRYPCKPLLLAPF